MHWGQIIIAYLVGSFFGIMQLLNLFKGFTGGVTKAGG
jgi:hypothetical protein